MTVTVRPGTPHLPIGCEDVGFRRPGRRGGYATGHAAISRAIDPVCSIRMIIIPDAPPLVVDGADVWFCGRDRRGRRAQRAGG